MMRREVRCGGLGLVSALTLLASSALSEIDRMAGDGAGQAWLARAAIDFQD